MLELQWSSFDTVLHTRFECSVVTVPVQVNATVSRACPISLDGVVLLERGNQVFSILLSLMADTKVVCNQTKADGSCLVEEQSWGVLGRVMAMLCKVLFELFVCQFAGLTETTDCTPDFDVHTAI